MKKEYSGYTKEQRCNLAMFRIWATRDKSGRVRWYHHGFHTRRIDEYYAGMTLREYGLTVDEFAKHCEEFDALNKRIRER